jgi:Zn-finger nucleic acid-binding protein
MCPKCGSPFITFEFEGIEVDRCLSCGGTWLDAGELEMILDRGNLSGGPLLETLEKAKGEKSPGRCCPRCERPLRKVTVPLEPPLELDRCARGHGLWFDAGELKTLVGSFDSGEEGLVARFFAGLFRNEIATEEKGE